MTERVFTNLKDCERAIKQDMRARERRMVTATRKAARQTRNFVMRAKVPVAHGELRDSLSVLDAQNCSAVVADAPHAAAVENGSRPHTPPLGPLIEWVTLRGMQGLTSGGSVKTHRSDAGSRTVENTRDAAHTVASALRARMGRKGAAAWKLGMQNDPGDEHDPAVVAVARAIQQAIARNGTRPHRFMGSSVDRAVAYLDGFVKEALPDVD